MSTGIARRRALGSNSNINQYTYFYVEALESNLSVTFTNNLSYSYDQSTWTTGKTTTVSSIGARIYFKAKDIASTSSNGMGMFTISKKCKLGGNIMSLRYGDDFATATSIDSAFAFYKLFSGSTTVIDASNLVLPATILKSGCYKSMFHDCINLVKPPMELPATTIVATAYWCMFQNCQSLLTPPTIKGTTITGNRACSCMFKECTSLTYTPILSATTLFTYCYEEMFSGCESLTTSQAVLPATILPTGCYYRMYMGCTNLQTNPSFTAETVGNSSCAHMFNGCTNISIQNIVLDAAEIGVSGCTYMFAGCTKLEYAPALPAKKIGLESYASMFSGCTSLKTPPSVLPALVLAPNAYQEMFAGCTRITQTPIIKATILSPGSCGSMFSGCTSLTATTPLYASTLTPGCYKAMFCDCTALVNAPTLPATTLALNCYEEMFYNCTRLNRMYVFANGGNTNTHALHWLTNVASSGNFIKGNSFNWSYFAPPTGWTSRSNYTVTGVTSLTIDADDAAGQSTDTRIRWAAITNGTVSGGTKFSGITITGEATSATFSANNSTSTVNETIEYTYCGVTATCQIKHYPQQVKTISCVERPDSKALGWVNITSSSESSTMKVFKTSISGSTVSATTMNITIKGYNKFQIYVSPDISLHGKNRLMVSMLDKTLTNSTDEYDATLVKYYSTSDGGSVTINNRNYQLVEFNHLDGLEHTITITYKRTVTYDDVIDTCYCLIKDPQ